MSLESGLMTLAILILGGVLVCLLLLLRRKEVPAAADPALLLMQHQVTRLSEQVAEVTTAVPREISAGMGSLLGQVGARLAENAQAVQRVGSDTGRLIADLSLRLGELGKGSQQILELGQDLRGLQQIFQAPKIRGGLGELSLGALLETGFPREHFSLQAEFRSGDRVDALLRLPGGSVSIDSKFPLAAFRLRLEAASDEQRQKAARAFARDVRKHVDDIAAKYIRPSEGTLDFALMYIPAESVFYEIVVQGEGLSGDDDLNTYALKQRVVPVSPNSLYAYLQVIGFGLMGLKVEHRAREILRGLQQLQGDLTQVHDAFDLGQKHLRNAQTAFTEAGERFGRLASQVGQFASAASAAPAAIGHDPDRPAVGQDALPGLGPDAATPPRALAR
jgi:DNA recombination protein RmuC